MRFDARSGLFGARQTIAANGTRNLLKNGGAIRILASVGLRVEGECGKHDCNGGQAARHVGPFVIVFGWRRQGRSWQLCADRTLAARAIQPGVARHQPYRNRYSACCRPDINCSICAARCERRAANLHIHEMPISGESSSYRSLHVDWLTL